MSRDSQKAPRWFITDRPINSADQDRFSHDDVADNLRTMINGASPDDRLMIGLLGPFGMGKSTVVQLLSQKMNSKQTAVLRVSAERHEQPGLHASLIFAFAEELVTKADVNKQLVEDELAALKFASAQTRVDLTASGLSELPAAARRIAGIRPWLLPTVLIVLGLLIAAAILVWLLYGATPFVKVAAGVSAFGVVALAAVPLFVVTGLSKWAQELIKPGSTTLTRPRVQSADEFERAFAALVKVANQQGKKKLVIAVDDIDRLSPSEVLTGLNAIRSFQLTCDHHERPVFIVSADEDIIESAIRRSNPGPAAGSAGRGETARAFVDRLFTHRQEMPVHAGADLTSYAKSLLGHDHAGAVELGDQIDNVVEVLIHDGVQDPRHVIRLLNAFFGDYRLAMSREAQPKGSHAIRAGTVTGQPMMLARMTVLKLDFPKFHKALFDDDDLLSKLERDSSGAGDEKMSDADKVSTGYITQAELDKAKAVTDRAQPTDVAGDKRSEWSALRSFVARTTRIRPVDDLRPFLYLGQGEIDRVIGGREARNTRDYLINNQVVDLGDQLKAIAATSDSNARFDAVTTVIINTIDHRSGLERANAVETIARNLDAVPEEEWTKIAVAVATALRTGAPTPQDTSPLLELADAATEPHDKSTLAEHILRPQGEPTTARDMVVLQGRRQLAEILGPDPVRDHLLQRISSLNQAAHATLQEWLQHWHDSPSSDLAGPFLTAVLHTLADPADDVPADWRAPMVECFRQAAADTDSHKQLVQNAATIIEGGLHTEIASILLEGLRGFPAPADDSLFQAIVTAATSLDSELLDPVSNTTWADALALTRQELRGLKSEGHAAQASAILDTYLKHHPGAEPDTGVPDLIGVITQYGDAAGTTPMATLMSNWTAAATDGRAFSLDKIVTRIDATATGTADTIQPPLSAALMPTGPASLRGAAREAFAPIAQSPVGGRVLNAVLEEQISQVQYNTAGLDVVATQVIMLCSLPSFIPREDLITSLVEKCRQQIGYGTGQQELLTILSETPWPTTNVGQAMDVLASQAGQLTSEHHWGVFRQLAGQQFAIPDALRNVIVETLVTEGDMDARTQVAVRAAAHLPVAEALSVALRLDCGAEIVAGLRDDASTALGDAIATMLNNPGRVGMPATVQTLSACAQRFPQSWAQAMAERVDKEIGGDPVASSPIWGDLIVSASGPTESMILERADAALDEDPPNASEFTKAAIMRRADVLQACVAKMLQAVSDPNEDRARSLAQLLTITDEARDKAVEALKNKRGHAARAAKAILSPTSEE